MIELLRRYLFAMLLLSCGGGTANAVNSELNIGYLELEVDPRYAERTAYAKIKVKSRTRPRPGAEVALDESAYTAKAHGLAFSLLHFRGSSVKDLLRTLEHWREQDNVHFVLLDLPDQAVAQLAASTRDSEVLLFNIAATEMQLRRGQCSPHLFHTIPSDAMKTDALAQYLATRRWREVLVLHGPEEDDVNFAEAFRRSASRFGLKVTGVRRLKAGSNPRDRDHNNVALLTADIDYQVVFVADMEGETGRYIPYQTKRPRPVVGSTGLEPLAWSPLFERHGAPQLNHRFERHAGRAMGGKDWAAWVAVKSIVQSAVRTRPITFERIAAYLRSDDLKIDGAKGPALSYRPWNNQLRQPILLATHDAVIARAPLEGFMHPTETMDTLGDDRTESECDS